MGTIISKDVEFELLPTNEVLVSVTVSAGTKEQNDLTTTVRKRISTDEFCAKAFPIMHQNYNSWPPGGYPDDANKLTDQHNAPKYKDGVRQMLDEPHDESLPPPDEDGIRRTHTRGLPGG